MDRQDHKNTPSSTEASEQLNDPTSSSQTSNLECAVDKLEEVNLGEVNVHGGENDISGMNKSDCGDSEGIPCVESNSTANHLADQTPTDSERKNVYRIPFDFKALTWFSDCKTEAVQAECPQVVILIALKAFVRLISDYKHVVGQLQVVDSSSCLRITPDDLHDFFIFHEVIHAALVSMSSSEFRRLGILATTIIDSIRDEAKCMSSGMLFKVDIIHYGVHAFDRLSPFHGLLEEWNNDIELVCADGYKTTHITSSQKREDDEECIICLLEFSPEDVKVMCPLSHTFHRKCIIEWFKKGRNCSICDSQMMMHLDLSKKTS